MSITNAQATAGLLFNGYISSTKISFFFLVILRFEFKALPLEPCPDPLLTLVMFQVDPPGFCLGQVWTAILLPMPSP